MEKLGRANDLSPILEVLRRVISFCRIHKEVKEGEMSKAQAGKLHREDRAIRHEERDLAKQNGGHITKLEKKTLNQQENAVSRDIGK